MSGRRLVCGVDPIAHAVLGDTPYGRAVADDIHQSLEFRGFGTGSITAPLALPDRNLTPVGSSLPLEPKLIAVYDSTSEVELGSECPRADVHCALGAHAASGTGLRQAALEARSAGIAEVRRTWFTSDVQFSQVVLALSSVGVAVSAPSRDAMRGLIHTDLIACIPTEPDSLLSDALRADRVSADQRRMAWLHHDLVLDASEEELSLTPRRLPPVSVLLATNRPHFIEACLARISRQSHPDVEVIVAVHGNEATEAAASLARSGLEGCVIVEPSSVPLGQVLNSAARRASGLVVTKWDDDDLYSEHHLVDMCLGLRYSGAEMVGKAPEFILFEDEGFTALRNHADFEQSSTVIAGGTMTMSRLVFDEFGGFPPIPRAVDHYMKRALIEAGGTIYRMHGFGFVLVRHGHGHTWEPAAGELEAGVHRTWAGLPEISGVIEACS